MFMNEKYEATGETKAFAGRTLYRIRAVVAIPSHGVSVGDVGGWIESQANLSIYGNAWIYDDAYVYGDAKVYGNAWVGDDANVSGTARVYGDALVFVNANVSGTARVYGDARVGGNAQVVSDNSFGWFSKVGSEDGTLSWFKTKNGISVNRGCFEGTLAEFEDAVDETHGDNDYGKQYKLLIEFIKSRAGMTD